MNKFLKILGGIFLTLLVAAGVVAAIFIPKWRALDKDVTAYIETNVPAIVVSWNSEELLKRGGAELLDSATPEQTAKVFSWMSRLGALKKLETPVGEIGIGTYSDTQLKGTWADYKAKAEFEAGPAQIRVVLKRAGETWQIVTFQINSPSLVPPAS